MSEAGKEETLALVDAEVVARRFHEVYERLAPEFSYETRKASAVPWDQVPENNRRLMIAVAGVVLRDVPHADLLARAMRAEDERDEAVERLADERVRGILVKEFKDGSLTLVQGSEPPGVFAVMVDHFARMLDESGAENYVEMTARRGSAGKEYLVRVQRCERPTPHELRRQAEADAAGAREQLGEMVARVDALLGNGGDEEVWPPGKSRLEALEAYIATLKFDHRSNRLAMRAIMDHVQGDTPGGVWLEGTVAQTIKGLAKHAAANDKLRGLARNVLEQIFLYELHEEYGEIEPAVRALDAELDVAVEPGAHSRVGATRADQDRLIWALCRESESGLWLSRNGERWRWWPPGADAFDLGDGQVPVLTPEAGAAIDRMPGSPFYRER